MKIPVEQIEYFQARHSVDGHPYLKQRRWISQDGITKVWWPVRRSLKTARVEILFQRDGRNGNVHHS